MSTRSVFLWLAAALVLGGIALLVLYKGPGSGGSGATAQSDIVPAGGAVVEFNPAALSSMTVTTPDGRKDTVLRTDSDQWLLQIGSSKPGTPSTSTPAAGKGPTWPLAATQARNMVRLLSELRASAVPESQSSVGSTPTVVRLALADGSARQLSFSERTLGGAVLVESTMVPSPTPGAGAEETTRRAMVSANVLNVLRNPGPRGWRETAALPEAGPDLSRITLRSDQKVIELARLQNKWVLRSPVGAPARADKVAGVIGSLAKVSIVDFLDDRSPEAPLTGLDAPALTITIETDRPSGAPAAAGGKSATETARTELALGGPSDSTGRRLFAAIKSGSDPRRLVAVDAFQLSETLSADPIAYISPSVTNVEPADVGAVQMSANPPAPPAAPGAKAPPLPGPTDRKFRRSLAKWADIQPDGKELLLADADASGINEFLLLLSAKPASSVVVAAPPGFRRVGYLALLNLDSGPLDVAEVGLMTAPAGAPSPVVFKSGEVYRTVMQDQTPRFFREWLARSGGLSTPAAPIPSEATVPTEMVK